MTRTLKIFSFALLSLILSSKAHAEFLPVEDEEGRIVEAEEARQIAPRRRGPEQTENSGEAEKRAKIERYLDEAVSPRGAGRRANSGRRGYRYNSETGFAGETSAPVEQPRSYGGMPIRKVLKTVPSQPGAFSFDSAPKEPQSYNRAFQAEAISETELARKITEDVEPTFNRKQRWRTEDEPSYRAAPPRAAKREASPNYPFDAERGPASDFASAFEPKKPTKSRQALLNVKKWMRNEEEKAARLEVENEDDENNGPTEFTAQIGLLGGMSSLKNGTEQTTSTEASPSNIYLGAFANFHLGQYFGTELEGFYGIAPKLSEIISDGTTETQVDRSVHHMGAMADLYLRYALPLGSINLIPKFGVGYGLLNVKAKSETQGQENSLNQSTSGLYWTVGMDFQLSESFTLGVDYAKTFNASGSITENLNGTPSSRAIEGAGFDRIRIGGYVRLSPKVSLGAQFVVRNLTAGSSAAANLNGNVTKDTESLNQILGVLMFTL